MNIVFGLLTSYLRRSGLFVFIDRKFIKKYRELVLDEDNAFLFRTLSDIVDVRMENSTKSVSKFIFGSSYEIAELILRQYLLTINAGQKLICRLIFEKLQKKQIIVYPLPDEWIHYFLNAG